MAGILAVFSCGRQQGISFYSSIMENVVRVAAQDNIDFGINPCHFFIVIDPKMGKQDDDISLLFQLLQNIAQLFKGIGNLPSQE